MIFNIFRIDWILVDSIIIIFLLILLSGVKIFKKINRWRSSLTNEKLSTITFKGSSLQSKGKNLLLKRFELTIPVDKKKPSNSKDVIIFLKTKRRHKLVRSLAEAISSYGLDVITLICKIRGKSTRENFMVETQKEILKLINDLFEFLKKNEIRINNNYNLITFIPTHLNYSIFLNDINNIKLISINPKLNKYNKAQIRDLGKMTHLGTRFFLVFSGKINPILRKITLNSFIQKIKPIINVLSLEKAPNSFKNYETILLGVLIKIIEKDSTQS